MTQEQQYETGKIELGRFLQIASVRAERDAGVTVMPTSMVDKVWHALLENKAEYQEFTDKAIGCRVDHLPNGGYGVIDWVPAYESMFGPLDPIWFADHDGNIDMAAHDSYRETGVWKASWDCTPGVHRPKPSQKQTNPSLN